ncbi:MAG: hypothetical protein NZL85_05495 [Fimbriimonadales bacterium]|nr:hypothetical protein [Fimbriimonadales bacterium]
MKKMALIGALLSGLLSVAASQNTRELVIFPFEIGSGVQQPQDFNLNAELMNALYAQLKDVPGLYVTRFKETNPAVRRALDENRLRRDRLNPPFNVKEADGTWRSARIGQILDVNYTLAGSIAEFRYDPATKRATITVSLDLVQVSDSTVVISLAESGQGRTGETEDPNTAYVAAIADVAQKLGTALRERFTPPAPAEPTKVQKPSTRRQERATVTLFGLLLLVGIRLVAF